MYQYGTGPAPLRVVQDEPAPYATREPFAMTPLAVAHDTSLPIEARGLYTILAGYWWQTGEHRASVAELARLMGRSPANVRMYMSVLVRRGLVAREQDEPGGENVYRPTRLPPAGINEDPLPDSGSTPYQNPAGGPPSPFKREREKKEPDVSIPETVRAIFELYRALIQPTARLCPTDKIRARLKRFTVDELRIGMERFSADAWWMQNNGARGASWFFHSDARSEQFLNLQPRPESRSRPEPDEFRPGRRGRVATREDFEADARKYGYAR